MEQSKKKKIVLICIIIAIIYLGPPCYRHFQDNRQISPNDIIGEYSYADTTLVFKPDGSISGMDYAHGEWRIVNADQQLVRIAFKVTQTDCDAFNRDWFLPYEMECPFTKDDVLEFFSENSIGYFKEKVFRYIRSESGFKSIEDEDIGYGTLITKVKYRSSKK